MGQDFLGIHYSLYSTLVKWEKSYKYMCLLGKRTEITDNLNHKYSTLLRYHIDHKYTPIDVRNWKHIPPEINKKISVDQ